MQKIAFLLASSFVFVSTLAAHPGHEHSEIPSLIRHPFADPNNVLSILAIAAAVIGALAVLAPRGRETMGDQPASR